MNKRLPLPFNGGAGKADAVPEANKGRPAFLDGMVAPEEGEWEDRRVPGVGSPGSRAPPVRAADPRAWKAGFPGSKAPPV